MHDELVFIGIETLTTIRLIFRMRSTNSDDIYQGTQGYYYR